MNSEPLTFVFKYKSLETSDLSDSSSKVVQVKRPISKKDEGFFSLLVHLDCDNTVKIFPEFKVTTPSSGLIYYFQDGQL